MNPYPTDYHTITIIKVQKKLQSLFEYFSRLGISSDISFTEIRRRKSVNIINLLFIAGSSLMLLSRLLSGSFSLIHLNCINIVFLSLSIFLASKGKHFFSLIIILANLTAETYPLFLANELPSFYIYLVIIPLLGVIAFKGFIFKLLLLLFTCGIYAFGNYTNGISILHGTGFYMLNFICFLVLLYFVYVLDKQQEELEATLEALEAKNKEIELFSQIMGHDLKAPLRTIASFSNLLKRDLSHTENTVQKEYLGYIVNGTKYMKTLINDLLEYSKIANKSYQFEEVDLNTIIELQKDTFKYKIKKENLIIASENLPTIYFNKNALKTVIQNIVSNGIKYQPKNKPLHIPTIKITYATNKKYHNIFISDNGIGIDKKNTKTVFEPFRRFQAISQYEGTGLGLSICKKILEKHDGKIVVKSSGKNGTTFLLEIPIIKPNIGG